MILFTSDVHIRPDLPERTDRFVRFVASRARDRDVEALYILGDLFDFWIGPRHPRVPCVERVFEALQDASLRGIEVGFVPGNRDFHLDSKTLAEIGVRRLGEIHGIRTEVGRVLMAHGDQFCSRDSAYRITRAIIRSLPARLAWRALPVSTAVHLASGFRSMSQRSVRKKADVVKEISRDEIRRTFKRGVDVMVCGHVHRQRRWRVVLGGRSHHLYTLAGWENGEPHLVMEGAKVFFGDERRHGA